MERADLVALQTFVTIVRHGSLRAAARVLGVNPPAISHQLKAFEERLGTPLLLRTTRSIALTDAGRDLLESCELLLEAVDDALEATRDADHANAGRLRITLPFRAWQIIIAPRLRSFQSSYPKIELELTIDEKLTDIVTNGFHAGIRLGDRLQDNMIAVRLSDVEETALVASPDYVARYGEPNTPEDLLSHTCIRYRGINSGRIEAWRFRSRDGVFLIDVNGGLVLNDFRTIVQAAQLGCGIGWSLKRGVDKDILQEKLVEVLAGSLAPKPGFHLYFPATLKKSSVLRVFIDHFSR